jgi:putative transposase
MNAVRELNQYGISITRACDVFDMPRSSFYYKPQSAANQDSRNRRPSSRALSGAEREAVHQLFNSDLFVDHAPRQLYATLLDEGQYHCSVSTMYRILHEYGEVRERRNQRQHPPRVKPQLVCEAPNQLWSWDITKLSTGRKYAYFYLYVILDIYSRYVVGWMVAEQESAELAQQLIAQSCAQQGVSRDQLTLHADRGGPMVALTTAQLLETLGVQKTHSRPYTPNDNAYSEAQFKTLKYRPDFPAHFASIDEARQWTRAFFGWYNNHHHHSGLALLTPAIVHAGHADTIIAQRNHVLNAAYARHPERFVRGAPAHPQLKPAVWINAPSANGGSCSGE